MGSDVAGIISRLRRDADMVENHPMMAYIKSIQDWAWGAPLSAAGVSQLRAQFMAPWYWLAGQIFADLVMGAAY